MKKSLFCILLIFTLIVSLIVSSLATPIAFAYETQFDTTSKTHIKNVFDLLEQNADASDETKIDVISAYFKEVPYVANRLVGDKDNAEQLVLALNELDCFTYVDYIEAFKRSTNEAEFVNALKRVRYINGEVTYLKRKHFFSDWFAENEMLVTDVLKEAQYANVIKSETVDINKGAKGEYIVGLPDRQRVINYIPREQLTPELLKTFKTGDYVGLRTKIAGLDVTHCGIIIQKEDGTYMRHASSQKAYRKVIDQKLDDYFATFKSPTGILVFRSNSTFKVQPQATTTETKTETTVETTNVATIEQATTMTTSEQKTTEVSTEATVTQQPVSTTASTTKKAVVKQTKTLPKTSTQQNSFLLVGLLLLLTSACAFIKKEH